MAATKLKTRKPRCTKYQKTQLLEVIEECMVKQMPRKKIWRFVTTQPVLTPEIKKRLDSMKSDGSELPENERRTAQEKRAAYTWELKKWDISESQVDKDIEKVYKRWDSVIMPEKKKMRVSLWKSIRKIITDSMVYKDHRTAVAAIDRACKLFGLDKAQKHEIEAKVAAVSLEELESSMKELEEK